MLKTHRGLSRILSLILCLVMVLSLVPTAWAATGGMVSGDLNADKLTKLEISQLLANNPTDMPSQVFDVQPSCSAPYAAGKVKTSLLQQATNRLNALRRIAGLPDVALSLELSENAQYGAVIQAALGTLNHYPSQPAGMDDSFYQQARSASSSSNLYAGANLMRAVDGWMDDSDYNNIAQLGHRRWQLNPAMGQVGFGDVADSGSRYRLYAVEKVFDQSGPKVDYDFTAWPASGNFPSDTVGFRYNTAWSVSLNPQRYQRPNQSELTVTLTREGDGKVWTFSGSDYSTTSLPYFHVNNGGYGVSNCIIFSPDGIDRYQGYQGVYTVRIDGLKTASGEPVEDFWYQVDFFKSDNYTPFADVKTNAFYINAVDWAVEEGITTGKTATTFAPNESCTHAQILTFLWRAAGKPESSAQPPIDMKGNEFYYKAVKWATEKGMIGANFNPDAPCNRAYAVLYIWQAFDKPAAASASPFTDVPAHWSSAPAVAWAVEKGVTTGKTATTFNPSGICSRGEIVTFLYRAYR